MSKIKTPREYFSTYTIGPDESWEQRCKGYSDYVMEQKIEELNNFNLAEELAEAVGKKFNKETKVYIKGINRAIEILKK